MEKLLRILCIAALFLACGLLIVGIVAVCKYVFLTSCITVENVKECTVSAVDGSDTLFALGGVLVAILAIIPTLFNERRIEAAKDDIEKKIFNSVREDMSKVVQAQAILSSLPATYPTTSAEYIERQDSIERAVAIWPPLKQTEHRAWGITLAKAIVYKVAYPADLKIQIVTDAIRFLEESVNSNPDAEALLYLAGMHGYRNEYTAMIASTKKAVRIDPEIREQFQENVYLLILIHACGNHRDRLEKLGAIIGVDLPVSKENFCQIMRNIDWVALRRTFLVNWTAIKKPERSGGQGMFTIRIMVADEQNGEEVYAFCYHQASMGVNNYAPEIEIGDRNNLFTLEKLYEELNKTFFLICKDKA